MWVSVATASGQAVLTVVRPATERPRVRIAYLGTPDHALSLPKGLAPFET